MVKLHVANLAAIGGRLKFDEQLNLALFRTKATDVWKYLETRNKTNRNPPDGIPRLFEIPIPKDKTSKEARSRLNKEIDTTLVRLCFQVNSGSLGNVSI